MPLSPWQTATLQNTDCIKCHKKEPATVERNGGLHKTAVGCLDCHTEHPPLGTKTIPQCAMCHTGKLHYELENCLSCHSDPHEPLALLSTQNLPAPFAILFTERFLNAPSVMSRTHRARQQRTASYAIRSTRR